MLYGFRHYPTPHGRRVECTIAAEDYERAVARVAAGYFDGVAKSPADGDRDSVRLTMTIGAALRLADALAGVGGDASATGRMLSDQLDSMAVEILPPAIGAPTHRRTLARAVGF